MDPNFRMTDKDNTARVVSPELRSHHTLYAGGAKLFLGQSRTQKT
jgi:hypothetical protein